MINRCLLVVLGVATTACSGDAIYADPAAGDPDTTGNVTAGNVTAINVGGSNHGADGTASASGGATSQTTGQHTAVSGAVGPVDEGAGGGSPDPTSCEAKVETCYDNLSSCSGPPEYCDDQQERCRVMHIACQGQREVCSAGYIYVDLEAGDAEAIEEVQEQIQTDCEQLAGSYELSGGSFVQDESGVSYSCCWLQPLDAGQAPGSAGAGNQ